LKRTRKRPSPRRTSSSAAQLRDQAYKLRKKKEQMVAEWKDKSRSIDGTVDVDIIAETVSKMTGVPLQRLDKGEAQRLLKMEDELQKSVISQKDAIHAIAKAVRRSRSGLKDPKRPMGSFIFLGPTGVGKTHLAKQLAKFMFGDRRCVDSSRHVGIHGDPQRFEVDRRPSGLRRLRRRRTAHREGASPPLQRRAAR
jgi:ATP-dependent Clp protease ATP-binding subunit ClpA